jgi:hypothetical protein
MTDWSTSTPATSPCLVGWKDGSWALGEFLNPDGPYQNVSHEDLAKSHGWVQGGTGEPFDSPPDYFAAVTSPPVES